MPTELEDVQKQTAAANRILTDLGLAVGVTSALGHVSMSHPGVQKCAYLIRHDAVVTTPIGRALVQQCLCLTKRLLITGVRGT